MKNILYRLLIIVIVGIFMAPLAANGSPAGPPTGLDVKVINDSAEPVPVTGDVTATVSGDVNVVNTPGVVIENADPIPVQDNNRPNLITTSTAMEILSGATEDESNAALPTCPEGERFMISGLYATPRVSDFPDDSLSLPAWIVSVRPSQLRTSGFLDVPLVVASEGHFSASAMIPGGQAGPHPDFADTITVRAEVAAPLANGVTFIAHVTGFCGTPFIAP
jgi:hypothetical protein